MTSKISKVTVPEIRIWNMEVYPSWLKTSEIIVHVGLVMPKLRTSFHAGPKPFSLCPFLSCNGVIFI